MQNFKIKFEIVLWGELWNTKKISIKDASKMVEFSFCIVGVKYIGKGLMYEMLKKIREITISQKYEFACCTVHNDNYPSKKNLLKIGFKYYMSV